MEGVNGLLTIEYVCVCVCVCVFGESEVADWREGRDQITHPGMKGRVRWI